MDPQTSLTGLGFSSFFSTQPAPSGSSPARVVTPQGPSLFRVVGAEGELLAEPAGRLRHAPPDPFGVGDWLHVVPRDDGRATIVGRCERRSVLARRGVGGPLGQVIAANVDTVFVVTSANRDLNQRRLERYLTLVWDGGAQPVVIVNKIDLCERADAVLDELSTVAAGAPVHLVSALEASGLDPLKAYAGPGKTVALLGSSGVGKSTLVNRLLGREAQVTSAIREDDDRGRHTTTTRNLLPIPQGGALIDTPGMRELGLLEAGQGLETAFPELQALAEGCRFRDCAHEGEPGCAVQDGVRTGELLAERLESWRRLRREQTRAARKSDKLARSRVRKSNARFARAVRQAQRDKRRGY